MKLVILASILMVVAPAYAQDAPGSGAYPEDSTFKLRAERFGMHDLPNFELKDWPKRPEVDAAIVNQIDELKTEVPDWHGLHHMVPGAGAAKN